MSRPYHRSRDHYERRARQNLITIPERVGPHVKLVFAEMYRQRRTYDDVEDGSGVRRAALKAWRVKNKPGLESMQAVLGFLGFDFVPIPHAKVLPPEVVAELRPIAERLGLTMPETIQAVFEIVLSIRAGGSLPHPMTAAA